MPRLDPNVVSERLEAFWDRHKAEDLTEIAARAGTSYSYLYQVTHSLRRPSPDLAINLEDATGGEITSDMLLSIQRKDRIDA